MSKSFANLTILALAFTASVASAGEITDATGKFYKVFFHIDLTPEQVAALTAK